jgi:hypothetical protein
MKKHLLKIVLIGICIFNKCTYLTAQIATEIDSKSVQTPRYTNLNAISTAIPLPKPGMLVYNNDTQTHWFFNGTIWTNLATATNVTLPNTAGYGNWSDDCSMNNVEGYQPISNRNSKIEERFGESVGIDGDHAIVGTPGEVVSATEKGSISFYKRNLSTGLWEPNGPKLYNPYSINTSGKIFGEQVAISGDYAVVGVPQLGLNTGLGVVYKRNSSTGFWEFNSYISDTFSAGATGIGDQFGYSIAISGDYIMVGSPYDDNTFIDQGSISIFQRTGAATWTQTKFFNSVPESGANYGDKVSISGENALASAPNEDSPSFGNAGSITFYNRNVTSNIWTQSTKIISNNDNAFGLSLSISGNYAAVKTGVYSKSIFIYKLINSSWVFTTRVNVPSEFEANYNFAKAIHLSGDYLIQGQPETPGKIGYSSIYKRVGEVWLKINTLVNAKAYDNGFGTSVNIDKNTGRFIIGSKALSQYIVGLVGEDGGLAYFGKVK